MSSLAVRPSWRYRRRLQNRRCCQKKDPPAPKPTFARPFLTTRRNLCSHSARGYSAITSFFDVTSHSGPDFGYEQPYTSNMLTTAVNLGPNACSTWTAFAGKMKDSKEGPRPFMSEIGLPAVSSPAGQE